MPNKDQRKAKPDDDKSPVGSRSKPKSKSSSKSPNSLSKQGPRERASLKESPNNKAKNVKSMTTKENKNKPSKKAEVQEKSKEIKQNTNKSSSAKQAPDQQRRLRTTPHFDGIKSKVLHCPLNKADKKERDSLKSGQKKTVDKVKVQAKPNVPPPPPPPPVATKKPSQKSPAQVKKQVAKSKAAPVSHVNGSKADKKSKPQTKDASVTINSEPVAIRPTNLVFDPDEYGARLKVKLDINVKAREVENVKIPAIDSEGELVKQGYLIDKHFVLSNKSYAKIYLGTRNNKEVAVKVIQLDKASPRYRVNLLNFSAKIMVRVGGKDKDFSDLYAQIYDIFIVSQCSLEYC